MKLDYPDNEFRTVMADPPWRYDDQPPRGGAMKHYETMAVEEIEEIDVERIVKEEAHLYLWTTNSFMGEAHDVAESWGFEQKTILSWIKPTIGVGHYFRNTTEHILFCTRGGLSTRANDIPTHFFAPVTEHSEKPDEIYEIVKRSSHAPMLELFARKTYPGWEGVGDEQVDLNAATEADW